MRDALERWRIETIPEGRTWGQVINGDDFINKMKRFLTPASDILEYGYGYGRLAESLVRLGVPFREYVGIDISPHFQKECQDKLGGKFSFLLGDFNTTVLDRKFHVFVSSLTLKHQYPTCRGAMANAFSQLESGGVAVVDFFEGDYRGWEETGNWIAQYSRPELREMLGEIGFRNVTFDTVDHGGRERLLVFAHAP